MNLLEASEKVENFKRAFSDLETKLSNAVGQRVLAVENSVGRHGITTMRRLGVLRSHWRFVPYKASEIDNKLAALKIIEPEKSFGHNFVLPMDRYAEYSDNGYTGPEWKLKEGQIIIPPYDFSRFGQNAEYSLGKDGCFSTALRISKPALEFHTGEDVELFFRFNNAISRYRQKNLQETAEFLKNRSDNERWMDLSYVEALDLLGLPAPKDFREKYDARVLDDRIKIVKELYELSVKEPQLKNDIERITKNCKGSPYEGDEVFVTAKQRGQLGDVYSERGRFLEKAVQLGINDWNERVDLAPGLSVVASEFLKGVQEYHSKIILKQAERN
ncbi:hypothetical protein HY449_01750 [Candidatus Pacearchaeota archaeon]|nr:hypothetical protein [Candidatus Pacearchaeota archaeon]